MNKIFLLLAGMLIGGLLVYIPLRCNQPTPIPFPTYKINMIDNPEKDSFITYRDADAMQQLYLRHAKRFFFTYHDDPINDPDRTVTNVLRGLLVKKSSLDSLYNLTDCDKFYFMLGINPQQRGHNPHMVDSLLTTVVVPIRTDSTDHPKKYIYRIATDKTKTKGDTTTLEYNSPCPPYCPSN